jgi:hypothetical protein
MRRGSGWGLVGILRWVISPTDPPEERPQAPGSGIPLPPALMALPPPRARPGACCNAISLYAPIIGVIATGAFVGAADSKWHWSWAVYLTPAIGILLGFFLLGFVFALAAVIRSERLWGLTAVGLILNGIPCCLAGGWLVVNSGWLFNR